MTPFDDSNSYSVQVYDNSVKNFEENPSSSSRVPVSTIMQTDTSQPAPVTTGTSVCRLKGKCEASALVVKLPDGGFAVFLARQISEGGSRNR